jgi:hypothetical protein
VDAQDELTTALIPVADRLVSAVHALDADAVAQARDDAAALAGDELLALRHLAVILAGMCSEDHNPDAALGWTHDPAAYQQFRSRADALTASLRAGRIAERTA